MLSGQDYIEAAEWRTDLWAPVIEDAIQSIGPEKFNGKKVLEIGQGGGKYAVLFAKLGAHVIGIENTDRRLAEANAYAKQQGFEKRCTFTVGDFFELEGTFDFIVTKSVLYSVKDTKEYARWIRKFRELLADDGTIFILENGKSNAIVHFIRPFIQAVLYSGIKAFKRGYHKNVLSNPVILRIFSEYFENVSYRSFYHLAPIIPMGWYARWERKWARPKLGNCFVFWLTASGKKS